MVISRHYGHSHRRGDTFSVAFLATDSAGEPVDLNTTEIAADLMTLDGVLIGALRVERTNEPAVFLLVADYAETEQWPIGHALCDIQMTVDGIRRSTQTITLNITRDVTRGRK